MNDCNRDIRDYHSECVALTTDQRLKLKKRRDTNRIRLRSGLARNDDPKPKKSVSQGSYAMRTVIQERGSGYDIDDGVVFTEDSLTGPRGGKKSPLDARRMVLHAVHSDSFKTPPQAKTNCVRVFYNDGPHVDIPVYREVEDWFGNGSYELASVEWRQSDPDGVNDWFKRWLGDKNRSGKEHSRELIRLMKSICKSRPSYSLPSGFVITVLIEECYTLCEKRLDVGLREVIRAVHDRLRSSLWVRHPVVDNEWLIDSDSEHKTRNLRDLLKTAVSDLDELDLPSSTRSTALKAWKKVLCPGNKSPGADFFDRRIAEAESQDGAKSQSLVAGLDSAPKPYGCWSRSGSA